MRPEDDTHYYDDFYQYAYNIIANVQYTKTDKVQANRYSITVNITRHTLTLFENGKVKKYYPVAVGKPSTPTPRGTYKIINKAINPGGSFGLTGCKIAYELAVKGKKVSIVEMMDDILNVPGLPKPNGQMLRDLLKYHKVDVYTSTSISEINSSEVLLSKDGKEISIHADTVVTATGYIPYNPMADKGTMDDLENVHVIGDADHVGNLMNVIWKAYEVAGKI